MNIRLTGRSFQDPNIKPELNSMVNQIAQHLSTINSQIIKRKYGVIPAGNVDGSNTKFVLPEDFNSTSLVVWLGPVKQVSTLYKVVNRTITFAVAPAAGVLECDYDPIKGK